MLHLENFFEKSFALLLTTPKDKFPNVTFEQIKTELSEEKLKKMDYAVNVNVWCQFCSNRELCTAYYCRSKE